LKKQLDTRIQQNLKVPGDHDLLRLAISARLSGELDYAANTKEGNTGGVLDRLLDPVSRCFTPETAKALVQVQADPTAQARIQELAEKCNEGELSADERSEYQTYVHTGNIIGILQAKARLYLKQRAATRSI
jgi:hypothetical protein